MLLLNAFSVASDEANRGYNLASGCLVGSSQV